VIFCLGLILVPNGKLLGQQLGDRYPQEEAWRRMKLGAEKNLTLQKIKGGEEDEGPGGALNLGSSRN